jgi:hypothetical protein
LRYRACRGPQALEPLCERAGGGYSQLLAQYPSAAEVYRVVHARDTPLTPVRAGDANLTVGTAM